MINLRLQTLALLGVVVVVVVDRLGEYQKTKLHQNKRKHQQLVLKTVDNSFPK